MNVYLNPLVSNAPLPLVSLNAERLKWGFSFNVFIWKHCKYKLFKNYNRTMFVFYWEYTENLIYRIPQIIIETFLCFSTCTYTFYRTLYARVWIFSFLSACLPGDLLETCLGSTWFSLTDSCRFYSYFLSERVAVRFGTQTNTCLGRPPTVNGRMPCTQQVFAILISVIRHDKSYGRPVQEALYRTL